MWIKGLNTEKQQLVEENVKCDLKWADVSQAKYASRMAGCIFSQLHVTLISMDSNDKQHQECFSQS